jgi:hypothetical protein
LVVDPSPSRDGIFLAICRSRLPRVDVLAIRGEMAQAECWCGRVKVIRFAAVKGCSTRFVQVCVREPRHRRTAGSAVPAGRLHAGTTSRASSDERRKVGALAAPMVSGALGMGGEVVRGVHERQVRECLRHVAQQAPRGRIVLFRQ